MALFDKFIKCDTNGIGLETLFASLMTKRNDGVKGFRVAIVNVADCDTLSDVDCSSIPNMEAEIRDRIYLDECGKPCVVLFNTVAAS